MIPCAFLVACASARTEPHVVAVVEIAPAAQSTPKEDAPPPRLTCLARYYAAEVRHEAGAWTLVTASGDVIPYAQAAEVYEPRYKTGPITAVTDPSFDPGAVRLDPLFFATYGKSAKEVQASLVGVVLGGKTVLVHRKIADPLRRVAAHLAEAMKHDASLAGFFETLGGTFNWRVIAGTRELSMHSWAIAIDLDTKRASYWHDETHDENATLTWKNRYPQAIVDAFEAEGFVWGGRWYHFDTMHFEYRPELLDPSCYG